MAHDFKMSLLGQVLFKPVQGTIVNINDFVAGQADKMVGVAKGIRKESCLSGLWQDNFFGKFFFGKKFQNPVHRGKIQLGTLVPEGFVDIVSGEYFPLLEQDLQYGQTGLGTL